MYLRVRSINSALPIQPYVRLIGGSSCVTVPNIGVLGIAFNLTYQTGSVYHCLMAYEPEPAAFDIELRKHVGAIAVVPASRRITTLARKCYNVLLHLAQEQGEQDTYHAPLKRVMVLTDYDTSNNYALVKQTLKQLVSTVVEWQSPSNGEVTRWDACGMLSGVAIEKHKSGTLTLEWSYAPAVRTQLLNPERYARISLEVVAKFRSHAAIALYEICSRYVDNPSNLTARQPWLWWRPVLSGTPAFVKKTRKPPEYRNFKRDVLKPAIAEINLISDIEVVGPIEHKGPDNKTIVEIQFSVSRKRGNVSSEPPGPVDMALIGRALAAGVKQTEAEDMVDTFGVDAFSAGLKDLVLRKTMPTDKVTVVASPGRWLRSILPAKVKEQQKVAAAVELRPDKQPDKRHAKWLDEWLRRRRHLMHKEFAALPEEIQEQYKAKYRSHLVDARSALLRRFDADGWEHRILVSDFLRRYALSTWGPEWDKPTAQQLLVVAGELGDG